MRRNALALAPLAALALLASPAVAQESPAGCPTVFYAVSQEQMRGPAGEPVTLTFSSDVQPARTPDRWSLTQVSPGPETLLQTAPSAPSATFTMTAAETTTYRIVSETQGCRPASATFTRTVTTSTPTPTPSSARPACPHVEFSADRRTIAPGDTVTITARRVTHAPGQTVRASLSREFPAPAAVVRQDAGTATVVTWPVRLGETHDFRGLASGGRTDDCVPLGRPDDSPFTVDVQPAVGIAARRDAVRDYTFTGRVLPARAQRVTLWRVEADGRRVLSGAGTVAPDGRYRIDRTFTGSGRFGFQVDVAGTAANLPGRSAVRPTVVH